MPAFPIIDTHLHLWDPSRISYSWQKRNAPLERAYRIEDYQRDSKGIEVEALVPVECHVDDGPGAGQYIKEIELIEEAAKRHSRIRAIVAKAPLERGEAVMPILEEMVARFSNLRGIRRIPEFAPGPRAFMLNPGFIEGVHLLKRYGLHFELNVSYTQMDDALELADRVPDVSIVLDHCGKPDIEGQHIELFRRHICRAAAHSNVVCNYPTCRSKPIAAAGQRLTSGHSLTQRLRYSARNASSTVATGRFACKPPPCNDGSTSWTAQLRSAFLPALPAPGP